MDLLGIPMQIIVGEKNLSQNKIEIKDRKQGNIDLINLENIEKYLKNKHEL